MSAVEVTIVRVTKNPFRPQRGVLLYQGEPVVVTLELPWLNNTHEISCIPEGVYECQKRSDRVTLDGVTRQVVYEVQDVPNRTGILIHPGNTAKDTHGCILVGREYTEIDRQPAIGDSQVGFAAFQYVLGVFESFSLRICHI